MVCLITSFTALTAIIQMSVIRTCSIFKVPSWFVLCDRYSFSVHRSAVHHWPFHAFHTHQRWISIGDINPDLFSSYKHTYFSLVYTSHADQNHQYRMQKQTIRVTSECPGWLSDLGIMNKALRISMYTWYHYHNKIESIHPRPVFYVEGMNLWRITFNHDIRMYTVNQF